jgi:hypothetical protein
VVARNLRRTSPRDVLRPALGSRVRAHTHHFF